MATASLPSTAWKTYELPDTEPEVLKISKGTEIEILQVGDPRSKLVTLFNHGFTGSAEEARFMDGALRFSGIRGIGINAPGVGRSTEQPAKNMTERAAQMNVAVADKFNLANYGVIGLSGGAQTAAHSLLADPHRVMAVEFISGLPDISTPLGMRCLTAKARLRIEAALHLKPWLTQGITKWKTGRKIKDWSTFVEKDRRGFIGPDALLLKQPAVQDVREAVLKDLYRPDLGQIGVERAIARQLEMAHLFHNGLDVDRIRSFCERIHISHGRQDPYVSKQALHLNAAVWSDADTSLYDGGHMMVLDADSKTEERNIYPLTRDLKGRLSEVSD